jgi:pimeloyl-ACP methyl ester carboxylesterase
MNDAISSQQTNIKGITVHYLEAGVPGNPVILLLHGYPESAAAFIPLMTIMKDKFHLIAPDLPGIGQSEKIESSDKKSIAAFFSEFLKNIKLEKVTVVGHDIGGMVAYAMLRHYPNSLSQVVIMNTAIPGIFPWEEVKKNPHIWHFAFFAVPELPEALINGKQGVLFDYFYDTLSANKNAIPADKRMLYTMAYQLPSSLKTSVDWYRAFSEDEANNNNLPPVSIPLLYLRGGNEPGNMQDYEHGLKSSGIPHITAKLIADSGHFSVEEQPQSVARAIGDFVGSQK